MNVPPSTVNLVFTFSSYPLKERLAARLCGIYSRWLGGFRTLEAREGSSRGGYELEALGGGRALLASKSLVSTASFNKYGLNLDALEKTALPALERAAAGGRVLLLDELGPMALKSEKFTAKVVELLFSPAPCLVFHRRGAKIFEKAFSEMTDTVIIELAPENWDRAVAAAQSWLDGRVRLMEK
ncbi:MAG TPA: hypothetical protein DCZ92_11360 [Elusimicrobia bacterium]|nr:MAG: hypothetical protein A2016_02405 [Elusimicrobia bacterium GWF2_62_30]HBA61390.1 hypothetical protein [Elusimicrobiota bacterium]HBZ85651.1 hypothetical protein [Candidatus Edwardsbacteria bacterium]